MIRTVIWFTYFWLYLLKTIPALRRVKKLKAEGKEEEASTRAHREAEIWAKSLVKLSGARIHVKGREHIPEDEPLLIVCNHQGNFDIPIILGHLGVNTGFISKEEVRRMPIIASWMEELGCVFMNRKDRRQSIKAILDGVKQLKSGHNLVIFPEGTRSKGGPVKRFKQGSFKLATKSGAAILPVTINGSYKIMEANGNLLKPADVTVTISKPIRDHQQQKNTDTVSIAEAVQSEIERTLGQPPLKNEPVQNGAD
ncbi:1-acyl-sn-glycerol-3-phosphate acyltransferase [Alteribacter lacisalsi]|uniref:1-acyl-sn-glycerol-3-phosphate acyltransferase n=1 Tax=Alteribacter lacisalsi TaxID=2045244 RepID=A0A2W0HTD7_9BACI|nr:lysophospholipid acyltransferase family protein [Alteribacter lacisalsi]PYZ96878.1 1-acyl-sn-glycerol-3-phosphate acyltransferase [Alteribacter lacisalsi]